MFSSLKNVSVSFANHRRIVELASSSCTNFQPKWCRTIVRTKTISCQSVSIILRTKQPRQTFWSWTGHFIFIYLTARFLFQFKVGKNIASAAIFFPIWNWFSWILHHVSLSSQIWYRCSWGAEVKKTATVRRHNESATAGPQISDSTTQGQKLALQLVSLHYCRNF